MSQQPRAAVLQFPGVNCEYESARALRAAGAEADILRWNVDPSRLKGYDLFLLPGGFSYQDRIRAGAVAAKENILDALHDAAEAGKPLLGICNGAQVLVEAGFVPGLDGGSGVDLALAPNRMPDREGYFTDWSHTRVASPGPCPSPTARAVSRAVWNPYSTIWRRRGRSPCATRIPPAHPPRAGRAIPTTASGTPRRSAAPPATWWP